MLRAISMGMPDRAPQGSPVGGLVGQKSAAARGARGPAAAPAEGLALPVPPPHAVHPLAVGAWGVEPLERRLALRVPPLPRFAQRLPPAVVHGQGPPVLPEEVGKRCPRVSGVAPEHVQRPLPAKPCRQGPGAISQPGLGDWVIAGWHRSP